MFPEPRAASEGISLFVLYHRIPFIHSSFLNEALPTTMGSDQVLGISTYTPEEVSNHSLAADLWIIIDRSV